MFGSEEDIQKPSGFTREIMKLITDLEALAQVSVDFVPNLPRRFFPHLIFRRDNSIVAICNPKKLWGNHWIYEKMKEFVAFDD